MEVAAAGEAGYAAGRARRKPKPSELLRFSSVRLLDIYHRARQRGLAAAAKLEQLPLFGTVHETGGGAARRRPREHRGKGQSAAPNGGRR
jgi:hypothetical protein